MRPTDKRSKNSTKRILNWGQGKDTREYILSVVPTFLVDCRICFSLVPVMATLLNEMLSWFKVLVIEAPIFL